MFSLATAGTVLKYAECHSKTERANWHQGFPPLHLLGGKEISSDAGWGCMLRVIQMTLAQAFIEFQLGLLLNFLHE